MLYRLIRRKGFAVNDKRVNLLYREGLSLRWRVGANGSVTCGSRVSGPQSINHT